MEWLSWRQKRKERNKFDLPTWRKGFIEWRGRFFTPGGFPFPVPVGGAVAATPIRPPTSGDLRTGLWEFGREIPQGFSPLSLSFKSSLFGPWARTRGFLLYLSLLYHNAHFWVSSCAEFKQGGYWREKMVNSQQIGDALNSGSTCNTFSESSNSCSYILFRFHCLVQWKIKGGVCLLANWKSSQHFFLMSRFLKILTRGYSFISFRKRGREKERTSM